MSKSKVEEGRERGLPNQRTKTPSAKLFSHLSCSTRAKENRTGTGYRSPSTFGKENTDSYGRKLHSMFG